MYDAIVQHYVTRADKAIRYSRCGITYPALTRISAIYPLRIITLCISTCIPSVTASVQLLMQINSVYCNLIRKLRSGNICSVKRYVPTELPIPLTETMSKTKVFGWRAEIVTRLPDFTLREIDEFVQFPRTIGDKQYLSGQVSRINN